MSSVLGFCFRFFGPFFPFFWALELGCGVFGACSLGLVLWGCSFASALWRLQIRRHSPSSRLIFFVPRCLLAVVFPAHILTTTAVLFLASSYHTSFPLHSPHSLGLASVSSINWSFTHSFLDSTISFGSLLLVTFIHWHLHLICFPVVIVISAQYHNTNFTFLFFFPCALLVSTKMRIIRSVNP